MHLYLQLEKPLVRLERDEFKGLLRRRASGEPIAYILGYRDFYRHRFKVTRAVLVPRPDTEILVERALELLVGVPSPTILEIGTGSGCIGISLAMSRSDAQVLAWDSSLDALLIAEENARLLECKQIAFENRDLFEGSMTEPVNLIVSNPPYISSGEAQELSVSVREFEPAMALFDSSSDGLSFYRYLAQHAGSWLLPAGVLVVECGHTQAKAVKEIFRINDLTELTITNDLAGKERVVSGRVP